MERVFTIMPVEWTDEALAARARGGDRDAYIQLVERYRQLALAYAMARLRSRDDAEDVTQEALLRGFRTLAQYRGRGCWGAWLMRIVRNLCTDAERRRRLRQAEPIRDEWLDQAPGPESSALESAERERLLRAVDSLPEQFRVPLILHYWARLTYREIAVALDLKESTAVGRVAVALRRLRRALPEEASRS